MSAHNWNARSDGLIHHMHRSSEGPALFPTDLHPGERICPTCHMIQPTARPCC